ncbi:MAG TPA: metal ABC transporter substrate-binding protein [Candidatus Limnocylindria bacterium]
MGRVAMGASLLLLTACASPDDVGDDTLAVVASTTQVGSVAAEVGGSDIAVTVLLRPGVEAHDFELAPAQGAALEEADLVLLSGAGLEGWLDDTLSNVGARDRVRDLSQGVPLRQPETGAGPADPHYWLSGPNAVRMVENARDALAEADPEHAAGYTARAGELIGRLEAADGEVRALIGEVPAEARKIVTDHDALGYFIDEYGLEFVGSILPSLDVSAEPNAQDVQALVATIRDEGVVAIFTESSVNPRLAQALAAETDARLVDEPLYTDSLGADGSGADTLDGMLVHNARVIRDGLLGN